MFPQGLYGQRGVEDSSTCTFLNLVFGYFLTGVLAGYCGGIRLRGLLAIKYASNTSVLTVNMILSISLGEKLAELALCLQINCLSRSPVRL